MGDCHAATPALAGGAREELEQRLAKTSIYLNVWWRKIYQEYTNHHLCTGVEERSHRDDFI
jgi:hypothetical protein